MGKNKGKKKAQQDGKQPQEGETQPPAAPSEPAPGPSGAGGDQSNPPGGGKKGKKQPQAPAGAGGDGGPPPPKPAGRGESQQPPAGVMAPQGRGKGGGKGRGSAQQQPGGRGQGPVQQPGPPGGEPPTAWRQPQQQGPPAQSQGGQPPRGAGRGQAQPQQQGPPTQQQGGRGAGRGQPQVVPPQQQQQAGPPGYPQGGGQPRGPGPQSQGPPGFSQGPPGGRGAPWGQQRPIQQQPQAGPPPQGHPPQTPPGIQQPQASRPMAAPVQQPVQAPARQQAPAQGQRKQPEARKQQSGDQAVASVSGAMAKLRVNEGDAEIVSKVRVRPGKNGRIIKVESNHLSLDLGKIQVAFHYDVAIVPETPRKFMRPVVTKFMKKNFPNRNPAFDGRKNLYTANTALTNNLNDVFEEKITITEEGGREKTFDVKIKFANKVDMTPLRDLLKSPVTPQEAIQVVDIALRMAPIETCLPVGRSFFVRPTNGIIDLGEGMEMYHGFYQSAIRGWKPLLNVDVAHKAFPQNINVVDAIVQLLSTGRQQFNRDDLGSLQPHQEEILAKYIKTLRVCYEIPGQPGSRKNYRVNGLGTSSARTTFDNNGQRMTVQEYFFRIKNYRLRYPDLPTLWVGNPQRADKVLLPVECCVILEGQAVNRKMTEGQTSKMIRHAATDTNTRKSKIVQGIQRANYSANPCIREFGFSVGSEFQKLDARVLQPPVLEYGRGSQVRVSKGTWRNNTFIAPVTINSWTFVNAGRYPPRPDEYRRMVDLFERSGREVGMNFAARATEPYANIPGRQTYSDIENFFRAQKGKYDVIFVIVPDSGTAYSYVKKAAEIVVGCLTQCIKSSTVGRKMNQQTAVNILLKVNSKLNGINHTFSRETKPDILRRPVMIMGADVTHPGPDSVNIPSVAAVTASHDPKAFKYNICWRLQNPKVEIIEDLEAIVIEHLKFFYNQTKLKPEAIIFFRDGVSEGQFNEVKRAEIQAIRAGCKRLQADGYEPKITFLVVQKRHHTRLFPMNPRDSEDRNNNVPAGTCVDTDITHPFMQDFYLVSHASIQGVAKPTKYCTLWDDNNMDNDTIEQLAYYLCHMFARCNRSVSYPAPTYYAHLAAARAKVYIENDRLNMDRLRDEFDKFQIKEEIRKGLPMFFV